MKVKVPKWCGKWVVGMDEFKEGVVGAKSKNIAGQHRMVLSLAVNNQLLLVTKPSYGLCVKHFHTACKSGKQALTRDAAGLTSDTPGACWQVVRPVIRSGMHAQALVEGSDATDQQSSLMA